MVKYSTGLLNQFAPHITELTEFNAPLMEEYKGMTHGLIHQFIILSSFSAKYPDKMHKFGLIFLRKTELVFEEYFVAISDLANYVKQNILYNDNPADQLSDYFRILHRFEIIISQLYQANMVLQKFLVLEKHERFWSKGDGSSLERVNILYNYIKHAEDKIDKGLELPGYQIWLTNSGISCEETTVSFEELSALLIDLADNAKFYGNPPKVIKEIHDGTYDQRMNKKNNV